MGMAGRWLVPADTDVLVLTMSMPPSPGWRCSADDRRTPPPLTAVPLVCSLNRSPAPSRTTRFCLGCKRIWVTAARNAASPASVLGGAISRPASDVRFVTTAPGSSTVEISPSIRRAGMPREEYR